MSDLISREDVRKVMLELSEKYIDNHKQTGGKAWLYIEMGIRTAWREIMKLPSIEERDEE